MMRNIVILTAVAVLVNHTSAVAEDNGALLAATYHGGISGEEEKNTFGYDPNVSSDLQIRFRTQQSPARSGTDLITTSSVEKTETTEQPGRFYGPITGIDEKDTFAH